MEGLSNYSEHSVIHTMWYCDHNSAVSLSPVRKNPERTFYWFFEAGCPVARDKGESAILFPSSPPGPHSICKKKKKKKSVISGFCFCLCGAPSVLSDKEPFWYAAWFGATQKLVKIVPLILPVNGFTLSPVILPQSDQLQTLVKLFMKERTWCETYKSVGRCVCWAESCWCFPSCG